MDNDYQDEDVIRPICRPADKERIMECGDLVTYPYDGRGGYSYGVVVSVLPGSIILDTYTADPERIEVDRLGVVLQYKKSEWECHGNVPTSGPIPDGEDAKRTEIQIPPTRRQPIPEGIVRL
jgi:hypothetical protein